MKSSDTKIAFIGLGLMGVPMAKNLLKAGYQIVGFDLSKEVAAKFSDDKGFQFASTPEQAIEGANITILMLPDSSIIDAVLWGSNGPAGIASKLSKNSYLIDMSSSSPISSKENNHQLERLGIKFIDAPVSGGVKKAIDGSLAIIVGGKKEHFNELQPLLECMGKSIVHVGDAGAAHAVKALNNYVSAAGLIAASEALNAANKFGLDPHIVNKVFNASTGRNNTTENKVENFMLNDAFNSGFSLALMRKDVQIALSFIENMNCYANLAKQCVLTAKEADEKLGKGADHTAMYDYVRSRAL
ncbi:NAD(P)-dependent oxidoreductase [Polynucleobacter nymphae]|uniref:NAD(P)-dependent oxidoreductase n=1 Tax=Polynucleobacter nymphae TaxID=2081043 RepID=UPI001C0C284D|nr:NAD(P)-dependent oxidoreductase [Polynucleobacter nymphae]MBU3608568.1 NAD(P)-dependent oxidoreductase [Polynucleobacter nymphae]